MMKGFLVAIFLFFSIHASAQVFTFECKCEHLAGSDCDICNTNITSRSFHGLLIYRNGTPYKWIDEPYTIRRLSSDAITFQEQIVNPENITIALFQTPFSTMAGYVDSTTCFCNLGGAMDTVVVDTPIIGNGTVGNPITIGQFGADTTMFLHWNGSYWYPSAVKQTWLENDLPYFLNDDDAITGGLPPGKTYLLAQGNTLAMPVGMYKVVIGCGFDCANPIRFFASDASATANGIPVGREYATTNGNIYGILYGFVRAVYAELDNDTLECNTVLPDYIDDPDAIANALVVGDHYTVTSANPYGAPAGVERVVSDATTTEGDAPVCCEENATLPYYNDDTDAIAGGLSAGYYYYLTTANPYGWPRSTKKKIQ